MDISPDQFHGLISLLLACLELVLVMNLLIFSEKNYINIIIIQLVTLLFIYQLFEFLICYFEIEAKLISYLALLTITLLPPLSLKLAAGLNGYKRRIINLIFLPALFFIFYYATVLEKVAVTECSVFYAVIVYPLGHLYGIFYFLPVILSIYLVYLAYRKNEGQQKKLYLILLIGYLITFLPPVVLVITMDSLWIIRESFICKFAFFLAISASYLAIMNKEEQKGDQS
jgi:hypothetical protein